MRTGAVINAEMNQLLESSDWLRRKVDRNRRMVELRKYVNKYIPEMLERPLHGFLDIGPGPGELIELAMAASMDAHGWDAETPEGGMGSDYLKYSRLTHELRGLDVTYCDDFRPIQARFNGALSIINLRGSIEQVMSDYMVGDPHDKHQDCRKLSWDDRRAEGGLRGFLKVMRASLLDSNGVLMVAANGAANTAWYDKTIMDIFEVSGFSRIDRFDERTHKLYV
jgi:hypothetical protein